MFTKMAPGFFDQPEPAPVDEAQCLVVQREMDADVVGRPQ